MLGVFCISSRILSLGISSTTKLNRKLDKNFMTWQVVSICEGISDKEGK